MPISGRAYTGLSNSFNNAVSGTIIDPLDWNDLFTDIETAINTLSSKVVINVLDYIPSTEHASILDRTSVLDCTTYIQSAIAAIPSGGGVLEFPEGKIITDTIRTPALGKPTWFKGQGRGRTLLQAKSSNSPIFAGVTALDVSSPYVSPHRHSGFTCVAHASGSTGAAIDMRRWSFSEVSDIGFKANGSGKWTYGFLLDATNHCYSNRIDDVEIVVESPISGALLRGATDANYHVFSRFTVIGSTMQAVVSLASGTAVYNWSYKNWHIEGISGVSTVAFDLGNGHFRHDFDGCWFEDVGDSFSSSATTTGSVTNCTFSGGNVQGISMPAAFGRLNCTIPADSASVSDFLTGSLTLGGSMFIPAGFGIVFDSPDVTISHSTNGLAFLGATNGYAFQDGPVTAPNMNILGNGRLGSGFSLTNSFSLSGWDVDGSAWVDFVTVTAANTPTCDIADSVTKAGNYIYRAGGTDVPVSDGGTGASTAAAAATNLGLGTADSPQFAAVNLGHATDTTLTRVSAGVIAVEGNTVWHAGNDGAGSGLDADLLDGKNTGTSGNVIPLLDGANTWSATQTFGASGIVVGASNPFSDSAGTLTLQNVDALDATTESTIEAAIDTLANLTAASSLATVGTITSGVWNAGAVTSSGAVTGTALIPTSSTVPSNGTYLPAANTLGWAINSAAELQLTSSAFSPAVSDGNALGTSSLMWSDLFLASGAVVNFNNGNVTITHSSGALAFNTTNLSGIGTLANTGSITMTNGSLRCSDGFAGISWDDNYLYGSNATDQIGLVCGGTEQMVWNGITGGVILGGSPTGSFKGTGTLNALALYDDNVLLTDYVFDKYLGNVSSEYTPRISALAEELDSAMFDPDAYAAFWKENRRLWGMPDLNDCINGIVKEHSLGAMIQKLWQAVELQAIHIAVLSGRIGRH
jgi:hypothetical protein